MSGIRKPRPVDEHDREWMFDGLCLNTTVNMWPRTVSATARALEVCRPPGKALCPVLATCLEYALANGEELGIWGGASGRERKRMAKRRRQLETMGVGV